MLEVDAMSTELRQTGISVVGDLPWGAHFCYFYETKQDLLDILIPYFKTGLENKEFCLWVISSSELLTVEDATSALRNALPDLDRYVAERSIEVVGHEDWFLSGNTFDPYKVADRFKKKLNEALARGYAGMRVNGSPAWLHNAGAKELRKFEAELDKLFPSERTIASCTYPLATIGADEIFDVVRTHQFAIARRQGEWEVIETPELIQAKQEIKRLNEELEQRVVERTNDLRVANEELRKEIAERKLAEDALRRSEDRNRLIIDTIPTMAWSIRPAGTVDFVNQRWLDYTGLTREQYVQEPTGPIHPEDKTRAVEEWLADMAAGEPFEAEMRLRGADGEYRWFLVRTAPLRDEQGRIVKWYGVSIDIEDRKQAEVAVAERLRFETLVTELSAAFANLSPNEVDHEIDKWLQTLVEFLGVDRATFFQFDEDWTTLYRSHSYTVPGIEPLPLPPIGLKDPFPWIADQLRRGVTVKWSRIPDDMPEQAAKEKEYAAKAGVKSGLNIPVLVGGSVICAISFTSIVTYHDWPDAMVARLRLVGEIFAAAVERKRAEERIRATTEQLRSLSASLQSAREEEGTRIGRELHDELGGALTSLKWDLESFDRVISDAPDQSQAQLLREKIEAMLRLADITIDAVRRISSELRPSVLDDLGLVEAIEWQARQFQTRTGIICHCEFSVTNVDLDQEQSTAIFRILQEALTNILRHAQATRVDIAIKEEAGEIVLTVSDNGRGITQDEKSRLQSLGLLGMRERAHLIGGAIDIIGLDAQGTVVTVRVPNAKRY
jgi:PAS domain S-box-containing protein